MPSSSLNMNNQDEQSTPINHTWTQISIIILLIHLLTAAIVIVFWTGCIKKMNLASFRRLQYFGKYLKVPRPIMMNNNTQSEKQSSGGPQMSSKDSEANDKRPTAVRDSMIQKADNEAKTSEQTERRTYVCKISALSAIQEKYARKANKTTFFSGSTEKRVAGPSKATGTRNASALSTIQEKDARKANEATSFSDSPEKRGPSKPTGTRNANEDLAKTIGADKADCTNSSTSRNEPCAKEEECESAVDEDSLNLNNSAGQKYRLHFRIPSPPRFSDFGLEEPDIPYELLASRGETQMKRSKTDVGNQLRSQIPVHIGRFKTVSQQKCLDNDASPSTKL